MLVLAQKDPFALLLSDYQHQVPKQNNCATCYERTVTNFNNEIKVDKKHISKSHVRKILRKRSSRKKDIHI